MKLPKIERKPNVFLGDYLVYHPSKGWGVRCNTLWEAIGWWFRKL